MSALAIVFIICFIAVTIALGAIIAVAIARTRVPEPEYPESAWVRESGNVEEDSSLQ